MLGRIAFIFGLLMPLCALAGPAEVSRVLKFIDFEERRLGNREDLPMQWIKLEGPGLPHYVNGRLSNDQSHSGDWSFRFDLNGGSLIYRYDPREIQVRPGAHYRIECYVKTMVLPHAKARMSAFLTDQDGNTIPGSVTHSEFYAARKESEGWHRLSIELTAGDKAKFLVLDLELLQPSYYTQSNLGERALFDQDVNGSAWFDSITVSQVPQLFFSTGKPGNVFRRSDPIHLLVQVNDRFTDDLAARLVVSNASGQVVYQRTGGLDMAGSRDLGPGSKEIVMALPDMNPGWYDATLFMTSSDEYVGQEELHFVHLPDDNPPAKPDPRFGVIGTDLPFEGWPQLPDLLPLIAAGRIKLSVWNSTGDIQEGNSSEFDSVLERLQILGITPTACLTGVPPSIAQAIGGEDWERLLKAPPDTWQPQLSYMIARHANHLDRWQLGADRDAIMFLQKPKMREVYNLLYTQFASLMDKPDLAMPWPAWYDLTGELPATVALSIPPEVLPSQLPLYIEDIRGHEGHNLSLSLQLLDSRYGREVQIRDLAQRVTYALAGGATRIDLPLPFTVHRQGERIVDEPQELLMVIRTLIAELGGATYEGRLPNTSNVEAFLFDRQGQGILVLWNRGSDTGGTKHLAINLGDHPRRVDLWGNATPVIQSVTNGNETVDLDIGPIPFFLVDVDGAIAEMRASVALDKPLLESSFEPHSRHIHFVNPGKTTISGLVKLVGPDGWTLTPSVFNFALDPGETFNREVSIEFPYNSFAGPKTIQAQFQIQSDRNTNFTVPITVSLGLSDVGMQTLALRDKDDLVVQQMISNYGDKPVDYTAFAVYPGQTRQERLISHLGPGRTTLKLYRFTNVQWIPNAKVRSGLRELEGTRILNDEVEIQ